MAIIFNDEGHLEIRGLVRPATLPTESEIVEVNFH